MMIIISLVFFVRARGEPGNEAKVENYHLLSTKLMQDILMFQVYTRKRLLCVSRSCMLYNVDNCERS